MRTSLKFILWLISADVVILAVLFLCGITGFITPADFSNNKDSRTAETATDSQNNTSANAENETIDSETENSTENRMNENETTDRQDITVMTSEETTPDNKQFVVLNTTSKVYMRDDASTSGNIICELEPNTRGEFIKSSGNWSQIRYNGQTGYVFSEYIISGTAANDLIALQNSPKIKINMDCNVRSKPDINNSEVLMFAAKDEVYSYLPEQSDDYWYAIILSNNSIGYISVQYATKTDT